IFRVHGGRTHTCAKDASIQVCRVPPQVGRHPGRSSYILHPSSGLSTGYRNQYANGNTACAFKPITDGDRRRSWRSGGCYAAVVEAIVTYFLRRFCAAGDNSVNAKPKNRSLAHRTVATAISAGLICLGRRRLNVTSSPSLISASVLIRAPRIE